MNKSIIVLGGLLAVSGFGAVVCSTFGNYVAFANEGPDNFFKYLWGIVGAAISITSAVTFGLSAWLFKSGQKIAATRTFVLFLLAFSTSIAGSYLYMSQNAAVEQAQIDQQAETISQLKTSIMGWQDELATLPNNLPPSETIQAYLDEVKSAGLSHQRPYRMKLLELGTAKKREALEEKIEEATTTLSTTVMLPAPSSDKVRRMLFAIILEILASQALASSLIVFSTLSESKRFNDWRDTIDETYS